MKSFKQYLIEAKMLGFVQNIETLTDQNEDFRRVLYTAPDSQLVLMMLQPKEDIGKEHHNVDQFFRVESGEGEAFINGVTTPISSGFSVTIPSGAEHNITNTGTKKLKLYSVYSPPKHKDGLIHHTKADALADKHDKYDGKITE